MSLGLRYFWLSYIVTIVGAISAFYIGGWAILFTVFMLAVLEISLSFDNAVVNASVLKEMDPVWQQRFLLWGMLIAVFGMRLVLPLVIVGMIAWVGPWEVIDMALNRPDEYAKVLTDSHHIVAAFGGSFLMLVFLKFFLDEEKDIHWIAVLEAPLAKIGRLDAVPIFITLIILAVMSMMLEHTKQAAFLEAGIIGVVLYIFVETLGEALGSKEVSGVIVRNGLAGFLYLEVLDASFSLDGVIAAFALSNAIFVIMIGLGIGAMFVRSLTVYFVAKNTLEQFRYLEHGAFWAIGALATIMFADVVFHVPHVVTGLIGAVAIGAAIWSSVVHSRKAATAVA